MILIALGANLPSRFGTPQETLRAARGVLEKQGIKILKASRTWLTAPVPFDPEQDWFHNEVVQVETELSAHDLLKTILGIEEDFGRIRTIKNAPRLLDLDLIAYNDEIIKDGDTLIVPHPRIQERLFVLKPLEDVSKIWNHPVTSQTVADMIRDLPDNQQAKPLEEDGETA